MNPAGSSILQLTRDQELVSPPTLPWEVTNAFSAVFKRGRMAVDDALRAVALFEKIPIRLVDVPLDHVLRLSSSLGVYAYDACMLACAAHANAPLLTLGNGLRDAARRAGIAAIEVTP